MPLLQARTARICPGVANPRRFSTANGFRQPQGRWLQPGNCLRSQAAVVEYP